MDVLLIVIAAIAGLLVGAGLTYWLYAGKTRSRMQDSFRDLDEKNRQLEATNQRVGVLEKELGNRSGELRQAEERLQDVNARFDESRNQLDSARSEKQRIEANLVDLEARLEDSQRTIDSVRSERRQLETEVEQLRQSHHEEHRKLEDQSVRLKALEKERAAFERRATEAETKQRRALDTVKKTLTGEAEELEERVRK